MDSRKRQHTVHALRVAVARLLGAEDSDNLKEQLLLAVAVSGSDSIQKELVRVTKRYPTRGYEIREEVWSLDGEAPIPIRTAYSVPDGDYIGKPLDAYKLWKLYGINRWEKRTPESCVCSLGYSPRMHRWFGWSHRACTGFRIGHVMKEDHIGTIGEDGPGTGAFPPGHEIADLSESKRAASEFAKSVAKHQEPDGAWLASWRFHGISGGYYGLKKPRIDAGGLKEVLDRWVNDGDKVYDDSMPVMVEARNLWKLREYTWTRENSRPGNARVGNKTVDLEGPMKWDALYEDMKARGWDKKDPLHLHFGKNGKMVVKEGNHRLAIAMKLRLRDVPVMFHFHQSVTKSPQEEPMPEISKPAVKKAVENAPAAEKKKLGPEEQRDIDNLMRLLGF
jgi:hypothetical protein